jgi:hypothetical protein
MSDSEHHIPLTINEQKGIERLGRDNVSSIQRGLFEIHNNGLWACDKAEREGLYPSQTEPEITITVKRVDGRLVLVYRDNGIGMDEFDLKNKYTKIAENTNPAVDTTSLFGVGVLAVLNTVGFYSGEVLFETRKRTEDEDQPVYNCSLSYNDGLQYTEIPVETSTHFDKDEYGTEYTMYLTDEMGMSQITDWIEDITLLNPRTIVYENELAENVSTYPEKSISNGDNQTTPLVDVTVDEYMDYLESKYLATTTLFDGLVEIGIKSFDTINSSTQLFMNNVFIQKNFASFDYSRTSVDVNINTEVPLVAEPDHKHFRKQVVLEGKLEQLDNPENYVAEKELSEGTITTPRLIGNREDCVVPDSFEDKIEQEVNSLIQSYKDNFRDKLQPERLDEIKLVEYCMEKQWVRHNDEMPLDELFQKVHINSDKNPELENLSRLFELYAITQNTDVSVLLTLGRESSEKREDALEDGYTLATIRSRGYPSDPEKSILGWEKVTEVYDSTQKNTNDTDKITVHYYDKSRDKTTYTSYKLDQLEYVLNDGTEKFETLYLFPPESQKNLSDWKQHTGIQKAAFANVTQTQFDTLSNYDVVKSSEEIGTEPTITINSVNGVTYTLQELQDKDIRCIGYTDESEARVKDLCLEDRWQHYKNIGLLSKSQPKDFCYVNLETVLERPFQYEDSYDFRIYIPDFVTLPDGFSATTLGSYKSKYLLPLVIKYWESFSELSADDQSKIIDSIRVNNYTDIQAIDNLFQVFLKK